MSITMYIEREREREREREMVKLRATEREILDNDALRL